MFNKIPTVIQSKELVNRCFSKASKIEIPEQKPWIAYVRTQCIAKISTVEGIAVAHLKRMIKKFPSTDHLHPFYLNVLDMSFDIDNYKKSLSRVQWSYQKIVELAGKDIRSLKSKKTAKEANAVLRQFYGRFASIVEDLSDDLVMLSACRDQMRKIPEIEPEVPTFLVAGMPNVGKSSLVAALSTARPRIATFPFTTKNINIGYMFLGHVRTQIIDTPGILDRPETDRNEMEKRAISALNTIDGSIIFLFDNSGTSGYTRESQETLFSEVKKETGKNVIRVQSKVDLGEEMSEENAISSVTGYGLDKLKEVMSVALGARA